MASYEQPAFEFSGTEPDNNIPREEKNYPPKGSEPRPEPTPEEIRDAYNKFVEAVDALVSSGGGSFDSAKGVLDPDREIRRRYKYLENGETDDSRRDESTRGVKRAIIEVRAREVIRLAEGVSLRPQRSIDETTSSSLDMLFKTFENRDRQREIERARLGIPSELGVINRDDILRVVEKILIESQQSETAVQYNELIEYIQQNLEDVTIQKIKLPPPEMSRDW